MRLCEISQSIDHALLHPTMTDDGARDGCAFAGEAGVASVCVRPCHVTLAATVLRGAATAVGTVVGFPHGGHTTPVKCIELEQAVVDGAREIDAVVNIGKLLSGAWEYVESEVEALARRSHALAVPLKLIFETGYLSSPEMKVRLCRICVDAGVAFVKTSTGFGFISTGSDRYTPSGAVDDDLALMVATVAGRARVKASGGIRCLDDVLRVMALGADRVGTSATRAILDEARARGYR